MALYGDFTKKYMKEVKEDLSGVAHIDMEPKLTGRNITMMLSPLPKHLQKPKFKNHFTLSEFSKLLNTPFAYTTIANLAIYYSKEKGLEYNKEASHRFGINLLGDVIVLPQDLMPRL